MSSMLFKGGKKPGYGHFGFNKINLSNPLIPENCLLTEANPVFSSANPEQR